MRGYLSAPEAGWRYLLGLGSNRHHHRHGGPRGVLGAAVAALAAAGVTVERFAPVITTVPLGPSRRRYANSAALVRTPLLPPALLALLKRIEREFGRRPGQRWSARVLDLDIVLWSGGRWRTADLAIPHKACRSRDFVLGPARAIAPRWRDPVTGLTVNHLHARLTRRLTRPRPLPKRVFPASPRC